MFKPSLVPRPKLGLVSTDSRMRQFYVGILMETDMMTYKLGGEYGLYVIRALSAVYTTAWLLISVACA